MRPFAIIHLCIVFTVICWTLATPFTKELYNNRNLQANYRTILGEEKLGEEIPSEINTLSLNRQFFSALPSEEQQLFLNGYEKVQKKLSESFWTKAQRSLKALFFDLPAFERAWILFSLILCIMALKQRSGVTQAIWLLPLLALCFTLEQYYTERPKIPLAMEKLVPTEKWLTDTYLMGKPLEGSIEEQKKTLQMIWDRYLVDFWSRAIVGPRDQALQRGEYAFSLARLEALEKDINNQHKTSESPVVLMAYFLWNLLFASVVCSKYSLRKQPVN